MNDIVEWLEWGIWFIIFTWYFFLYNLAAEACANNIWWAAKYGSVEEFPLEQFIIVLGEHLWGCESPRS